MDPSAWKRTQGASAAATVVTAPTGTSIVPAEHAGADGDWMSRHATAASAMPSAAVPQRRRGCPLTRSWTRRRRRTVEDRHLRRVAPRERPVARGGEDQLLRAPAVRHRQLPVL